MQAWNQVKVISQTSGFIGQAGLVIRVEKLADAEIVFVKLDTTGTVEQFAPTELVIL